MTRYTILPALMLGIAACAEAPPEKTCSTTTLIPPATEVYSALVQQCPAKDAPAIVAEFYIGDHPVEQLGKGFYLDSMTGARTTEQPYDGESVQFLRNLLQASLREGDTSVEWTSSPGYKWQFNNGDVDYEVPDKNSLVSFPEIFWYDPFLGKPFEEVAVRSRNIYHRFHVVNKSGEQVSATEISPIHVHIRWLTETGMCRLEGLLQNYARGVKLAADVGVNPHPSETDFLQLKLYGANFIMATDAAHLWVSETKLIVVFDENPSPATLESIIAQMSEEQREAYLARLELQKWSRDQLIGLLLAKAPSNLMYHLTQVMQEEFDSFEPETHQDCN